MVFDPEQRSTQEMYALRQDDNPETAADLPVTEIFGTPAPAQEEVKGPSYKEQVAEMTTDAIEVELALLADSAHDDTPDDRLFAQKAITLEKALQERLREQWNESTASSAEIQRQIDEVSKDPNSEVTIHPSGVKLHVLKDALHVASAREAAFAQADEAIRKGLLASEGLTPEGTNFESYPEAYSPPVPETDEDSARSFRIDTDLLRQISDPETVSAIDKGAEEAKFADEARAAGMEVDGDVFTSAPDYTGGIAIEETGEMPVVSPPPPEDPVKTFRAPNFS